MCWEYVRDCSGFFYFSMFFIFFARQAHATSNGAAWATMLTFCVLQLFCTHENFVESMGQLPIC